MSDKRLSKSTGYYNTREELIEECKRFKEEGLTTKAIATMVGVCQGTVSRLLNGDKNTYSRTAQSVHDDDTLRSAHLWSLYKAWKPVDLSHLPIE